MYIHVILQNKILTLWRAERAITVAHAQAQTKAPHLAGGAL